MNDVIRYNEIPVLTTKQIAEAYGTDRKTVNKAFERNKTRFTVGKHFIALTGEEKREFFNRGQNVASSNRAKTLYLWTERGALLIAKSINTDTAWEALERVGQEYDLDEAREIYCREQGEYPQYMADLFTYFPEMGAMADKLLDRVQIRT